MKTAFTLEASAREKLGKGATRELRRSGRLPAVLYGKGQEPLSFSLDAKDFLLHYYKGGITNKLVDVKLGGKSFHVLPREIQVHPVSDNPEHIDFLIVDENSRLTVDVPVRVLNTEKCVGVKLGGSVNMVRHAVDLVCKPDSIPPVIKIDVEKLNIGDSVHISEVTLPEGVEPAITDRDFTILTITGRAPESEEEEEGAEGETAEGETAEGEGAEAGDEGAAEGES